MRDSFDRMFSRASSFRRVSPTLRELLHCVYDRIVERPSDPRQLKLAFEALFVFLSSSEGRTDANCAVTDLFFSETDRWKADFLHLPEPFRKLIANIGGALHDTVHAPNIAMTFGNLPEQLLERTRGIALSEENEKR
ncbi:MAG TPA: hypothetical protein VMS12_02360 [Thermoanaerobaculia bacterium]|nr:hypothetical protein [Thermoanaerobaculia bacterium]